MLVTLGDRHPRWLGCGVELGDLSVAIVRGLSHYVHSLVIHCSEVDKDQPLESTLYLYGSRGAIPCEVLQRQIVGCVHSLIHWENINVFFTLFTLRICFHAIEICRIAILEYG